MSQKPEWTVAGQRVLGNPIVPALYAVAIIVVAVSIIGALFQLGALLSRKTMPLAIDEIISIVMLALGGVAGSLLLAGVATAINYLQNQMHQLSRMVRAQEDTVTALSRLQQAGPVIPAETGNPSAQTHWADSQQLEQMGELLHEIHENVLLSPEQRQAKRRQHLERTHRQLSENLSQLLAEGKFTEAQRRLDDYDRLFPEDRRAVEQFQSQVDLARAQCEESDYQQAADRIRDFMGMAAWDRADEVIQELLARHPRSQRVRELVEGLRTERAHFEQLQRQQGLAQIEQLIFRKEYREALRQANELLRRFPDSAETQTLRSKLDTLRDNAEIAMRKDLEEQFKELMRSHRYIEALALAQDIMTKFPGSPQAKVLREQLPQLTSKAKLQMDQVG